LEARQLRRGLGVQHVRAAPHGAQAQARAGKAQEGLFVWPAAKRVNVPTNQGLSVRIVYKQAPCNVLEGAVN
jgi:hypothetical protein